MKVGLGYFGDHRETNLLYQTLVLTQFKCSVQSVGGLRPSLVTSNNLESFLFSPTTAVQTTQQLFFTPCFWKLR